MYFVLQHCTARKVHPNHVTEESSGVHKFASSATQKVKRAKRHYSRRFSFSIMMDLVQQAAHLNMEGAAYLEAHDEQQALISFNNALECMSHAAGLYYCSKLIREVASVTTTQLQDLSLCTDSRGQRVIPLMAVPKPHDDTHSDSSKPMAVVRTGDDLPDENEEHFIYDKALIFNPAVARTAVDSLFYSAVIIYNTALAFHERGKCSDLTKQLKAITLYDISLELLRESATRFNCANII